MNRTTFFKHFELLADQPDAVAKMRELVLELGVRGLLVESDKRDEATAKLLEKIRGEKIKFLAASKLKASESLPEVDSDEAPFNCPVGWQWVRLGTISNRIHYGYTASADHLLKDVRLLRITDIQDNQVNWDTVPGCQISAEDVAKYELHENDILIARTGGTIGKTFLVSNVTVKAVFASYLIRVIPSSQVCAAYLKLFLESGPYWQQLRARSAGTGQPNVNGEALSGLCVSLPPLAEQRRIVAKVDELMALCDELEQRQQARQHASGRLQQSALHHLLAAREPVTFAGAWQRVRDHFHHLHDSPDAMPQLRQAILQLVLQGRLGTQQSSDVPVPLNLPPAETTIDNVREREDDDEGGAQADASDQPPYELPANWRWFRLGELAAFIGGSQPPKNKFIYEAKPGYTRLVQIRDFKSDKYPTYVPDEFARRPFKKTDVMIGRYGPPVFQILRGLEGTYNVALMKAQPKTKALSNDFLFYLLQEPRIQNRVIADSDRTAGQSGVRKPLLHSFMIGLPPLAEQKRIVARVEELLRQCDTLEAHLHQTRTLGAHLLDSTLHHLLAA